MSQAAPATPIEPRRTATGGVALSEEARAKGQRVAAENRERARNLASEMRALEMFEKAAPAMAKVLIDAAQGRAGFERLSPKERAAFAVKVLEYGVGRPRTTAEVPGPVEAAAQAQGLHFGVGSPQGDLLASVGADPGSEGEELASQRFDRQVEIVPDGEGDEYVPAHLREDISADEGSPADQERFVETQNDVSPGALESGNAQANGLDPAAGEIEPLTRAEIGGGA